MQYIHIYFICNIYKYAETINLIAVDNASLIQFLQPWPFLFDFASVEMGKVQIIWP